MSSAESVEELRGEIERFTSALGSDRLQLFPIRHHSPACAWQLARWIRETRPGRVLVEGPASFDALLPDLLHPDTRTPFAVYSTYLERRRARAGEEPAAAASDDSRRFAAFYPFCENSPELAALRAGQEVGAALGFIDLGYPEQVRVARREEDAAAPTLHSLLSEHHLERSRFLAELARRCGCRDHDELWDHLFEFDARSPDALRFFAGVAAYCYLARRDQDDASLELDGSLPRERFMAERIRAALDEAPGGTKLAVVTGGFHTAGLLRFLASPERGRVPAAPSGAEQRDVLMPYGFEQLDALNGYAAGMPMPSFYDRVWAGLAGGAETPFLDAASQLLLEIGALTRAESFPSPLSAADEIAALAQARRLASFRGHPEPSREDLLDAVRSCFVKGDLDAEGRLVMEEVLRVLRGGRVGAVVASAAAPPLLQDFRRLAERLTLALEGGEARSLALDLYKSAKHRRCSRLLHALRFLEVPFARRDAGPDFVNGVDLERVQELWRYAWSPLTDAALIEQSLYGASVAEAAAAALARCAEGLEERGEGRSARAAALLVFEGCLMGLHDRLGEILERTHRCLSEDPSFASLVGALDQLALLWESREPLEAHRLPAIPELIARCYERACARVEDAGYVAQDEVDDTLRALRSMRQLLASPHGRELDAQLFWGRLAGVAHQPDGRPACVGGALGVLFSTGRLDEEELSRIVLGWLDGARLDSAGTSGLLRGLLATCREIAWQIPAFLRRLDELLARWDDAAFTRALPELRLAFSELTPRELDRTAERVAQLHGGEELGDLVMRGVGEGEVQANLALESRVRGLLARDGLDGWLQPPADAEGAAS